LSNKYTTSSAHPAATAGKDECFYYLHTWCRHFIVSHFTDMSATTAAVAAAAAAEADDAIQFLPVVNSELKFRAL